MPRFDRVDELCAKAEVCDWFDSRDDISTTGLEKHWFNETFFPIQCTGKSFSDALIYVSIKKRTTHLFLQPNIIVFARKCYFVRWKSYIFLAWYLPQGQERKQSEDQSVCKSTNAGGIQWPYIIQDGLQESKLIWYINDAWTILN